ncbi:hypothetical protein CO2235_U170001 [Cupriavidus oxalaticus]|uniref:Uncharacterized protein n=1 Tax=Cupriavidus oxalaticus TaxID=96344 RepID=A0A375FLT6_9BURK|nr:hypothetical protein CO2235_U170001 [Cupriavidus oxalaticus]
MGIIGAARNRARRIAPPARPGALREGDTLSPFLPDAPHEILLELWPCGRVACA